MDDHAKEPLEKQRGADCYRVLDDIAWNAGGAVNLGFQEAEGWVIYADIDHLITKEMIDEIGKWDLQKGTMYLFGRKWIRNSDACYMIHKDDFEKIGGYDEDFSGHYGYVDVEFMDRCRKNLNVIERRDIKADYFEDEGVELDRDETYCKMLYDLKKHNQINEGKRIRFNWEKI